MIATTITLTVTGTWPDEVTETRTTSVTLEEICVPDETTTTTTIEAPTTTTASGPPPFTGSSTLPPLVGLVSLGAGGALWFMGRRRVARRA